ncbi:hypothetical protein ACLB2K_029966 [Fragaria x ananassa]
MAPLVLVWLRPTVYRKKALDKSTNQYCQYDSQVLTMFTSSLYLAALIASVVAAFVTRKLGRKRSMFFGGVLFCVGTAINATAMGVWMLILGRILLGFGIRFSNQSVPLYLSEMAPSEYRGRLNIMFQLSITIDTPNSMIERGQRDEVENQLRRIRGVDDVREEFSDLILASDESKKIENPLRNLRQRKYRPNFAWQF